MTALRHLFITLLISILLTGCQSQPTKKQPTAPQHLAVFKQETIWLITSSTKSNTTQIHHFNDQLKARLKLYGATKIVSSTHPPSETQGLRITSKINNSNPESKYQLTVSRRSRELISESYPNSESGADLAINQFLMLIHQKIAQAETFF